MIVYRIALGSWPLQTDNYHRFLSSLGWVHSVNDKQADVLILPGGSDIGKYSDRDNNEAVLYREYLDLGKPVIGICRGMQLMLHLAGANIIKHIPDDRPDIMHTTVTGHWIGRSSWHTTELGLLTNSRHHQGFSTVPANWEVLDKTPDGIIEAVRCGNQFGVQWHPEREEMINTMALQWWIEQVKKIL